jgi:hypothetical protein
MTYICKLSLKIAAIVLLGACWASLCGSTVSEDFSTLARRTYNRVIPCLKSRLEGVPSGFSWDAIRFPEDAQEHYEDLLARTRRFRTDIRPHSYTGYSGPWLENHFIEHFSALPLEAFGGLIPLFVQWTDIHVHQFAAAAAAGGGSASPPSGAKGGVPGAFAPHNVSHATARLVSSASNPNPNPAGPTPGSAVNPMPHLPKDAFLHIHKDILAMLRPTVLYVAVSQDDQGLFRLSSWAPNVLSLSAGGYGHVPLPLIKGEIAYQALDPEAESGTGTDATGLSASPSGRTAVWAHEVGFFGTARARTSRVLLLNQFSSELSKHGLRLFTRTKSDWVRSIATTKFNLAPRGFGRTSFRLSEIVQIGRIPVYLYDDYPWIPYAGTNISVASFGYVAGTNDFASVAGRLAALAKNASKSELYRRLRMVQEVREHYTYRGVLAQLEQFFRAPLGEGDSGGQLRCAKLLLTTK